MKSKLRDTRVVHPRWRNAPWNTLFKVELTFLPPLSEAFVERLRKMNEASLNLRQRYGGASVKATADVAQKVFLWAGGEFTIVDEEPVWRLGSEVYDLTAWMRRLLRIFKFVGIRVNGKIETIESNPTVIVEYEIKDGCLSVHGRYHEEDHIVKDDRWAGYPEMD